MQQHVWLSPALFKAGRFHCLYLSLAVITGATSGIGLAYAHEVSPPLIS